MGNEVFIALAVLLAIAAIALLTVYIMKKRLLKLEWRYYFAFKDISSRVCKRAINDISDLSIKESIVILHRYSENEFAQRQKTLLERAELDPAIMKNTIFDDDMEPVRFVLRNTRRVMYMCGVANALIIVMSFLGTNFISKNLTSDSRSLIVCITLFGAAIIVLYRIILKHQAHKLHKTFPIAYAEMTDFLKIRNEKIKSYEKLVIRHKKEYRVKEDSHMAIYKKYMNLCENYDMGLRKWYKERKNGDDTIAEVIKDFYKDSPKDMTQKMHDDGVLETIQTAIMETDKIILYNGGKTIDNALQFINTLEESTIVAAEDVRNAQLPNWKMRLHTLKVNNNKLRIAEIIGHSVEDTKDDETSEDDMKDVQSYLFFLDKRLGSDKLRIVVPNEFNSKGMIQFLKRNGFDNVQEGFNDLVLRKQNNPELVCVVVREKAHKDDTEQFLVETFEKCPENYILLTVNRQMNIDELNDEETKNRLQRIEAEGQLENLLVNLPAYKTLEGKLLRYDTLYRFVPSVYDTEGYIPTPDDRDVRSLVSHIKAYGLGSKSTQYMEDLADIIDRTFGEYKHQLTLFCIPSSRKLAYTTKFSNLSSVLAAKCGMDNSFSHVRYLKDFVPTKPNEDGYPVLSLENNYFKDRIVLMFDELINTGKSSLHYYDELSRIGAKPIMLLAVAKSIRPNE